MTPLKVNLGCGLVAHEGWANVDGSLNAWLANHTIIATICSPILGRGWKNWPKGIIRAPLEKKLPFKDDSASIIYTSHFVEHLTRDEARKVLSEMYRILEPGGTVRIVVPDLEGAARDYVEALDQEVETAADDFLKGIYVCKSNRVSPFKPRDYWRMWFDYQIHFWMYDRLSMGRLLKELGFVDVQNKGVQESDAIEDIAHVEREGAVGPNGKGIAVEAKKPTP